MANSLEIVDPSLVGMNPKQLSRISEHLNSQYIDKAKVVGTSTMIARKGQVCYLQSEGLRDRERDTAMTDDTIFRIYSMTKPITSVAIMQLYEQGKFALTDPVHRFIPEWKKLGVYKAGRFPLFETVPCQQPMTIRDLLMHTSGLTYDFMNATNIDHAYRKLHIGFPWEDNTLKDMIDSLSKLPLEFQPGSQWNYSVATDVLGYLIEVISGKSLPDYFQENIFDPLGMVDTAFNISPDKVDRFASCYARNFKKEVVLQDDSQDSAYQNRKFFSGGGGLVSTIFDYYQFCKMLLNGGELNGNRIIGPRTLDFMTMNHIPDGADMSKFATGSFSETNYEGIGFGLGFANKLDVAKNGCIGSEGEFFWGGAASTAFWVDPKEEMIVIFMCQFMPSATFNFRGQLQSIIYPAIID